MTTTTLNAPVGRPNLLSGLSAALRPVGEVLAILLDAPRNSRKLHDLALMTDEQFAKRGTTREAAMQQFLKRI